MRPDYRKWQKAPEGKKPFQVALFFRTQEGQTVEVTADEVGKATQSAVTFLLQLLSFDITSHSLDDVLPRYQIKKGWCEAGKSGVRVGADFPINGQLWTPILWDGEEDPDWHKAAGLKRCD